jgi:tetratricopeptide (TPR) repeat protein
MKSSLDDFHQLDSEENKSDIQADLLAETNAKEYVNPTIEELSAENVELEPGSVNLASDTQDSEIRPSEHKTTWFKRFLNKIFHKNKKENKPESQISENEDVPPLSSPEIYLSSEEVHKTIEEKFSTLEGKIESQIDGELKQYVEKQWAGLVNDLRGEIQTNFSEEVISFEDELSYWRIEEKNVLSRTDISVEEKISICETIRSRRKKIHHEIEKIHSEMASISPNQGVRLVDLNEKIDQQAGEILSLRKGLINRTLVSAILSLVMIAVMGVAGIMLPRGISGDLYTEVAWLYQLGDRSSDAKNALIQAEKFGLTTGDSFARAGETYRRLGDFSAAVSAYEKAVAFTPNDADLRIGLARSYTGEKRYQDAIEQYKKTLNIIPPGKDYIFLEMGSRYVSLGNPEQALIEFQHALDLNPNSASAYYLIGETQRTLQNAVESEAAFKKAVELKNDNATYLIGLGRSNLDQGDYQEALDSFDQVLTLDPENANAYFYEGEVYKAMENYTQAEEKYNKAIGLQPKTTKYYIALGEAYQKQGDCVNSTGAYAAALKLDVKSQAARDGLAACKIQQ